MMENKLGVILRAPSVLQVSKVMPGYKVPSISFLQGKWHVTHSTLPMWKSKRNVCITYTALPPSSPSIAAEMTDRLDDMVSYQSLDSDKEHTVHGVDKASNGTADIWDWRGKGWLIIASSHWEVLGWGDHGAADDAWVVTYFAKTLFTPAGVDIYSRRREGLQEKTLKGIKKALTEIEDSEFQRLAESLFEITTDQ